MKNLYKWLIGFAVVVYIVICFGRVDAEAAYTDDGVYYPDLWSEVDWGEYEQYKDELFNKCQHMVVSHSEGSTGYNYGLLQSPKTAYKMIDNVGNLHYGINTIASVYVGGVSPRVIAFDYTSTTSIGMYYEKTWNSTVSGPICTPLGSTYDYRGNLSELMNFPYCNIAYEPDPVQLTFVDITVDNVNYTVSESLPYYLALKNPKGSIYLLFSDVPFTALERDAYKWQFGVSPTANVVCYSYFPGDTGSFLDSRSFSVGFDSFITSNNSDYFCNYPIHYTDNLLYIMLSEKASNDAFSDNII